MNDYTVKTPQQLGAFLHGYRKNRELTQQQVGVKTGFSQTYISFTEADPSRVSLARLLKILAALDLELVVREKKPSPSQTDW